MTLEEEIANKMAKQMAKEMDQRVLWMVLKDFGWTEVTISRQQDNNHAIDITHWLTENCQGAYERNGQDFIFENPKDASMFILKWV